MDRRYDSRSGYSNGDFDAPRSHRRRGSYESDRRGSVRSEFADDNSVYRTIRITNLNPRVSDKEVSEVVYREFRNFGDYNVKVTYHGDQRIAFVNFQFADDASAAMREFYNRLILFDEPVRLGPVYPRPPPPRGSYVDRGAPPPPPPSRGYSPPVRRNYMDSDYGRSRDMYRRNSYEEKVLPPPLPPQRDNIVNRISHLLPEEDGFATRTLFVGNVDPDITAEELRAVFDRYGYVEDVDIKKPGAGGGNPYAFIRYFNLNMAHAAKVKLSGKFIGPYQCKIGYGKPSPTSCVWVGNLGPWISKHGLGREFDRFGTVQRVVWPEGHDFAYITYNNVESAKEAVSRMRGHRLKGAEKLLRTDFVDLKHPESDLNFKTFDRRSRSLSLSPGRRSHSRHISRSRSFSRSVSGSRSPASSTASMKAKRKKHKIKEKESQSTKRSRMSAGPSQVRSDKKRKRRSASVSSNASSHSDESNPDGRHAPMSRNAPQAKNGATELKTVTDMSRCLPMVWNGVLSLKNSAFVVDMHLVTGSPSLVSMLMCNSKLVKFSNLKLTQRLRMEPSKLDEVRRRIHLSSGDWCVMLAVTSPTNTEILEPGMQERPIKNLVSYLRQKEAAGVLSLPPNSPHGQETGLLHTFAPSEFAHEYLKQRAPKLDLNLEAEDYIVVILVRVNV